MHGFFAKKLSSGSLNYNSEKELYPLRCKVCGEAPYVGKAKTKFWCRFNNYKSKHGAFRKGNRNISKKPFHNYYCLDGHIGIDYFLFYFPSLVMYLFFSFSINFWLYQLTATTGRIQTNKLERHSLPLPFNLIDKSFLVNVFLFRFLPIKS